MKQNNRASLDFQSLFITPIQRVPRYRLLFQDLLKNIPNIDKNKEAIVKIEEGLELIKKIASKINDKTKETQNVFRLVELVNQLGFKNLIQPGRVLLHENNNKKFKMFRLKRAAKIEQVNAYLFNDMIVIKKVKKKSAIFKNFGKEKVVINLKDRTNPTPIIVSAEKIQHQVKNPKGSGFQSLNGFKLKSTIKKKTTEISLLTENYMHWIKVINENFKNNSGLTPLLS